MTTNRIATGVDIGLRTVEPSDFDRISDFEYSVSIVEPHADTATLAALHAESGFWTEEAAAVVIIELATDRMIGTVQSFRSGPCIHGLELGYVVHDDADRGKRYASQALRLFSDHLFTTHDDVHRQQLIIEVWNTASWKVAERAGFMREGVLRSCGFGSGDRADCFVYSRTRKDRLQELASHNGPG